MTLNRIFDVLVQGGIEWCLLHIRPTKIHTHRVGIHMWLVTTTKRYPCHIVKAFVTCH